MSYSEGMNNFFGRTLELSLLKKRVVDLKEGYRQNIAFLGNPFVGKSYTLQYFLNNLDDSDITAIYLDLEHKDFTYIFPKFIGSLLYNYSKNHKLPLHDDLSLLIESTRNSIPLTIDVIKKLQLDFNRGKLKDCFLGLMLLPEIFTNETGKFSILVLDEFQNLEEIFGEEAFQELGKKIMTQKRCLYVLASSYPLVAKRILSEKLSLLFGNFETIQMDMFDFRTSQQFIEQNLGDKKIGYQLQNFLTDFTGGHPLYLNLICQEMISLSAIYNQNEIYMPILTQAIENTLFNRWGVISRHFELITNELCSGKGNRMIPSLLLAMANGLHKIEDIFEEVNSSKLQIKQKILRLLDLGILIKNGQFYYLKDKLFRYWIKYVYQKRIKDIEFTSERVKKQFKDELNKAVEQFKVASRQDFSTRMVDLLNSFSSEAFDLNGRNYKLPNFKSLEPMKIKDGSGVNLDVIKGISNNDVWYIVLKKENFHENDVSIFLDEMKRLGEKPQKCLIVSLMDLDEHARLKALQEKFWIWSEGELNTLLTLFDKPFILR